MAEQILRTGSPSEEAGKTRVWADILRTGGASAYAALASLVALVLTARGLGPAGRGIYAAATAWATLFATLGSLSLGQVFVHHVAGQPRDVWINQVSGTVPRLVGALTCVCWLVAFGAYQISGGGWFHHLTPLLVILPMLAVPFYIIFDCGRYILYALDQIWIYNLYQILGYSVHLALLAGLIFGLHTGVIGALTSWTVLYVIMGVATVVYVRKSAPRPSFDTDLARRLVGGGVRLHISTIGTFVQLQSSVLILNYFRPPAETAYYQLATQIVAVLTLIPTAISTVTYGLVTRAGPRAAWTRQRRLLLQGLLLVGAGVGLSYPLVPYGITLLAGPQFTPAVPLVQLMLTSLLGMTAAQIMASQWVGRGLFWQTAALSGAATVISLGSDFILIPRYGAFGAVFSTLFVYGMALIANGIMAMRVEREWKLGETP